MDEVDRMAEWFEEERWRSNVGYIYILCAENGLYKIGKSKNVRERVKALQTGSPVKIEVFRVFKTINMDRTEKTLHDVFDEYREIGEWFRLPENELDFFLDREGDNFLLPCYL